MDINHCFFICPTIRNFVSIASSKNVYGYCCLRWKAGRLIEMEQLNREKIWLHLKTSKNYTYSNKLKLIKNFLKYTLSTDLL